NYVLFFRDVICAYNSERWDNVVPTLGSGLTHYVPWAFMQMKPKTRRDIVRATGPYDYDTLNPFAALGGSNQTIVRWIYPTATSRTAEGVLTPSAAASWTAVDTTTIDVNMRKDRSWDDGRPRSAHDVQFSFDYAAQMKIPSLRMGQDVVGSVENTCPRSGRF